jgi:hypothetical protein
MAPRQYFAVMAHSFELGWPCPVNAASAAKGSMRGFKFRMERHRAQPAHARTRNDITKLLILKDTHSIFYCGVTTVVAVY